MKHKIVIFTLTFLMVLPLTVNCDLVKKQATRAFMLDGYTALDTDYVIGEFEQDTDGWVKGEHCGSVESNSTIPILGYAAQSGEKYLIMHGDGTHKISDKVATYREFSTPINMADKPHLVFSHFTYGYLGGGLDYRTDVTLYSGEKSYTIGVYPLIGSGENWNTYVLDFSGFDGISSITKIEVGRYVVGYDEVWGDGKFALDNMKFTYRSDMSEYALIPKNVEIETPKVGEYYTYPSDENLDKLVSQRLENSLVLTMGSNTAYVDGVKTKIDENENIKPITVDDRSLVPLRFVAESLGATADYDEQTGKITLTLGADTIEIFINKYTYNANGNVQLLDVPATIVDNRTLIPIRAVAEEFCKNVDYFNGLIVITDKENKWDSWYDGQLIRQILAS